MTRRPGSWSRPGTLSSISRCDAAGSTASRSSRCPYMHVRAIWAGTVYCHKRKHQNPWGQSSRHRRLNVQTSTSNARSPFRRKTVSPFDPNRGRDAGYPAPPAQIRAGALTHTAPASGQTSAALSATCRLARLRGPQAACVTRTRHSVRYVLWPVDLPLAPVLRSIDSAGTLIPLFADFTATMTESDSSSPFVSGYDSSVFPSRPRH